MEWAPVNERSPHNGFGDGNEKSRDLYPGVRRHGGCRRGERADARSGMERLGRQQRPHALFALEPDNAANVAGLKPVWIWDSGKFGRTWEITPLMIDGLLYLSESQS